MNNPIDEKSFICPNCDGEERGETLWVSTDVNDANPWAKVLQRQRCVSCGRLIPAHLAERWNNRTIAKAKREWFEIYENTYFNNAEG
jgi:predicted RNA-binding Zn-ribbon protein involved in translation (DUF1610 family)